MEQTILAYLAGVMDSDGCFAVYHYRGRSRGRFSVEVFVALKQVQPEAVDLLVTHFGGVRRMARPSTPHGKPLFVWKRSARHAAEAARILLPFLRLKRRQAEIIITMQEEITRERFKELGPPQEVQYRSGVRRLRRYYSVSAASLARRQALLREIRMLNDTRYPLD